MDANTASAASKTEPLRPVSYSSQLQANISNTQRYVVTGPCERQGVHQISQILKHSGLEEMWAFLPQAYGTRECQWHEIGRVRLQFNIETALARLRTVQGDRGTAQHHPAKARAIAAAISSSLGSSGLESRLAAD